MYRWLIRWPLVALIAAAMGWRGLWLMFLGGPWFPSVDHPYTRWVVAASVTLWSIASFGLARAPLSTWAIVGLASPFIGGMLVAPPASLAFVMAKCYIACPVGLVTGLLIGMLFRTSASARRSPLSCSGEVDCSPECAEKWNSIDCRLSRGSKIVAAQGSKLFVDYALGEPTVLEATPQLNGCQHPVIAS